MSYLIVTSLIVLVAAAIIVAALIGYGYGELKGHRAGVKLGRDEQWVEDYLAAQRKTQSSRDNLGRFKKRKASYGKIKITAQQNQF